MANECRNVYLGVDVGSVSTNFVLMDPSQPPERRIVWKEYLRTQGAPLAVLQSGMKLLEHVGTWNILGVGTTGSGRSLAGAVLGADVVKNEITAHAVAALEEDPQVQTIIEIGGQDSKLIVLRNGVVTDFAMNTVCAAGTGSFLDQQAARLNLPIGDFGSLALESKNPVSIAGRCTVFAESDMIHKQQLGHGMSDILAGLCKAMVRNYMSNLAKGKDLRAKVLFQGGVAANTGMKHFLQEALGEQVHIPEHYDVMGAIGAAYLAKESLARQSAATTFVGFKSLKANFANQSHECTKCSNHCEIVELLRDGRLVVSWGARCHSS